MPDASARNAEILDPYRGLTSEGREAAIQLDRVRASPISGIATGVSIQLGADLATQDLVYGMTAAGEGGLIAIGGLRGAFIPGNNSQRNLRLETDLRLRNMPGWTAEQRAAANLKVGILDISSTSVTPVVRSGFSARAMFAEEYGVVSRRKDIDHLIDLQLGGANTRSNLWPLDLSVNRSLGAQIQNQIQGLPPGTRINRVTIGD